MRPSACTQGEEAAGLTVQLWVDVECVADFHRWQKACSPLDRALAPPNTPRCGTSNPGAAQSCLQPPHRLPARTAGRRWVPPLQLVWRIRLRKCTTGRYSTTGKPWGGGWLQVACHAGGASWIARHQSGGHRLISEQNPLLTSSPPPLALFATQAAAAGRGRRSIRGGCDSPRRHLVCGCPVC